MLIILLKYSRNLRFAVYVKYQSFILSERNMMCGFFYDQFIFNRQKSL